MDKSLANKVEMTRQSIINSEKAYNSIAYSFYDQASHLDELTDALNAKVTAQNERQTLTNEDLEEELKTVRTENTMLEKNLDDVDDQLKAKDEELVKLRADKSLLREKSIKLLVIFQNVREELKVEKQKFSKCSETIRGECDNKLEKLKQKMNDEYYVKMRDQEKLFREKLEKIQSELEAQWSENRDDYFESLSNVGIETSQNCQNDELFTEEEEEEEEDQQEEMPISKRRRLSM